MSRPSGRSCDYFLEYLRHRPLFYAIIRGVEARLMEEAGPFEPPALDLGCGDGFFAALLAGDRFFAGLDPDIESLRDARRRESHLFCVAAAAGRMPFPDGFFATVMANSVLEHIPDLGGALNEIHRVLRPGGRLLLTSPSHRFADLLAGSTALRAAGFERLAQRYGQWFHDHSRHFHACDGTRWKEHLESRGFAVRRTQYYLSGRAMRAFDVAHYLSVARLLSWKLTHQWVLIRIPPVEWALERWLRRYCDPSPQQEGGCIFLEAYRRPY